MTNVVLKNLNHRGSTAYLFIQDKYKGNNALNISFFVVEREEFANRFTQRKTKNSPSADKAIPITEKSSQHTSLILRLHTLHTKTMSPSIRSNCISKSHQTNTAFDNSRLTEKYSLNNILTVSDNMYQNRWPLSAIIEYTSTNNKCLIEPTHRSLNCRLYQHIYHVWLLRNKRWTYNHCMMMMVPCYSLQ